MPQAGFDPLFAESAEFTELKTDAPTTQVKNKISSQKLFENVFYVVKRNCRRNKNSLKKSFKKRKNAKI